MEPIELSGYYFVNEQGKLVCILENQIAEVIGVIEYDSGYFSFKHQIIKRGVK